VGCPGAITGEVSDAGKPRFSAGVPDSKAGAVDASLGDVVETTGEREATWGAFDDGREEAPATMVSLSKAALVSAANVGQLASRAVAAARTNLNIIMARG
jgi:hypothetical protein